MVLRHRMAPPRANIALILTTKWTTNSQNEKDYEPQTHNDKDQSYESAPISVHRG